MRTAGLPAGRYFGEIGAGLRGPWADLAFLVLFLSQGVACAASGAAGAGANGRHRAEPRDTHLAHEDCPVTQPGVLAEDINGDGHPDRLTLVVNAHPQCTTLDFNFDGVTDVWVYFDERGLVRRRESDFDRDGSPDEVSTYRDGVLAEQRRVTLRVGKLDTWHYYSAGKLTRTERDANGDDYIDQWWEYPDARGAECPLIHSDVDGDGQPDPGATVDVCRDHSVSSAVAPSAAPADEEPAPAAAAPAAEVAPAAAGTASAAPQPVPGGRP
jgi:hypothetical protein